MTIYQDIAAQYAVADGPFAHAEQVAFAANDDAGFDLARSQRRHNDQSYFLYLFTRLESQVNGAVDTLLQTRLFGNWADTRVWDSWSRNKIKEIHFLAKVSVLTDKSQVDYARIREFYDSRNHLAHGGDLQGEYVIPVVAQEMHDIVGRFVLL